MAGGFFYIEYTDGRIAETEFTDAKKAKKAYVLYDRNPEDNAKGWGWDTKYETPTLTQQIRAKKISKELV